MNDLSKNSALLITNGTNEQLTEVSSGGGGEESSRAEGRGENDEENLTVLNATNIVNIWFDAVPGSSKDQQSKTLRRASLRPGEVQMHINVIGMREGYKTVINLTSWIQVKIIQQKDPGWYQQI